MDKALEFNDYCHSHQPPIAFIKAEVRGLFGNVFCDFGPEFTVLDVDGEEPHTGIIASISNDNPALVSCVDDERLEFQDGDLVVFSEVHGMPELNDGKPRKVINARPYSFSIEEDTTNYGIYQKGGIVTQVKQPKVLHFKPLREALNDPGDFLLSDFSKFERPPLLHLAFQALDKLVCELGRFPSPGSEEDAQKLISVAGKMNEALGDSRLDDVNPKLLRHFAFGAKAVLNPMAAMFGGIVGQEVVKACSGKFHPLFQVMLNCCFSENFFAISFVILFVVDLLFTLMFLFVCSSSTLIQLSHFPLSHWKLLILFQETVVMMLKFRFLDGDSKRS